MTIDEVPTWNKDNLTFDILLSTKEDVKLLKQHARIIGPLGLMPNTKSGTLVNDDQLQEAIDAKSQGEMEFRVDRNGQIYSPFGKSSFET